jgi:MFS transporter, DHA1 family, multidrug resistance protein
VRVPPASMAFTLLLGFLVALPSFGIDMSLPALTAIGAALHVAPAQAGLMMSLFMLGFAFLNGRFSAIGVARQTIR